MQTFTIEQIKNYLKTQDSLGDIHYNLTEANVIEANNPSTGEMVESDEVEIDGKYWFEDEGLPHVIEVVESITLTIDQSQSSFEYAKLLADAGRLFHVKEQFK